MALRWFATQPIYLGAGSGFVRAFNQGDYVPDSIVASHGLDDGRVTQVDVSLQNPAIASAPLLSSTIRRIEYLPVAEYNALSAEAPATLYITF